LLPEIITQSFLKTDLLRDEELITEIEALTNKIGFPLKKILVFQSDVQDSGTPDVYIFENFNTKNIFLSNTFIKRASKEEVCALVSRELGTRRCYYGLKKFLLNEACSLGIIYAFSNVIQNQDFYHQFGFDRMAVIFGATMFKILIAPLKPVANSLFNLISRKMHLEASKLNQTLKINY
jgi:STE24 endopeptidase